MSQFRIPEFVVSVLIFSPYGTFTKGIPLAGSRWLQEGLHHLWGPKDLGQCSNTAVTHGLLDHGILEWLSMA